jgi:hypothetical protein
MSDADIALNDKLKQEEIERLNLAGGEGGDDGMGFESLLPEDKKMLLEMLQYAKDKAKQVNESSNKKTKKKSKKVADDEENKKEENKKEEE